METDAHEIIGRDIQAPTVYMLSREINRGKPPQTATIHIISKVIAMRAKSVNATAASFEQVEGGREPTI